MMADRPIIFSAPMVRALLDGRKTQTRRLLNPQPAKWEARVIDIREPAFDEEYQQWGQWETIWNRCSAMWEPEEDIFHPLRLRYAKGDRLYVREACWIAPPGWTDSPVNPMGPHRQEVAYKADDRSGYTASAAADYKLRLRPSIHMPRWASRLTLTVEDVRVERLQAISEADAIAEGVERGVHPTAGFVDGWKDYSIIHAGPHKGKRHPHAIAPWKSAALSFQSLWETLHGGDSWAANPFVVALTFRVERGNIDQLEAA